MKRLLPIALVASLAVSAIGAGGCTRPDGDIEASGRVVDGVTVVAAPALASPVADVTAGVTTPTPGSAPKGSSVATLTGLGQRMRVTQVYVAVGDRVKSGDRLARLDDRALIASIDVAEANRRLALAQVDIIDARLSEVADARATIADARATVYDTIGQVTGVQSDLVGKLGQARAQLAMLESKRAELSGKRAALVEKRAQLETQLAQLEKQLANLPPGADPTALKAAIAKVKAGIAQIDAGIRQIDAGLAQIDAGIAKLTAAIAKIEGALGQIDSGLAQARSGLSKLDSADATTADARATLKNARATVKAAAEGTTVAIDVAKLQRDLAVVRAPVDGVVTSIAGTGDVVVAGAPVAIIRQTGVAEVDVWLAPEKAAEVAKGDAASVRIDSRSEAYDAKVTDIGVRAMYPPAWLATQETHLTRAVPVRVTLDDPDVALPAGTPADVVIRLGQ